MNEEPLHMIPERFRKDVLDNLNADEAPGEYRVKITGELCPFCRYVYSDGSSNMKATGRASSATSASSD